MQECVLPVRCVRCGTTFDLWYDLLSKEGVSEDTAGIASSLVDEERMCWQCRREAFDNIGQIEEESQDELTLDWE